LESIRVIGNSSVQSRYTVKGGPLDRPVRRPAARDHRHRRPGGKSRDDRDHASSIRIIIRCESMSATRSGISGHENGLVFQVGKALEEARDLVLAEYDGEF
jgi:hypothetical protein